MAKYEYPTSNVYIRITDCDGNIQQLAANGVSLETEEPKLIKDWDGRTRFVGGGGGLHFHVNSLTPYLSTYLDADKSDQALAEICALLADEAQKTRKAKTEAERLKRAHEAASAEAKRLQGIIDTLHDAVCMHGEDGVDEADREYL